MDIRCKNCFKVHDNEYARCPYCGYSEGEPPKELYHLYPGTELLGRYVIGEVLGFGGFGITYKAWDKKFETILAIKEYYPSGIVNRNPGESEVILFTGKKKDIFDNGLIRFLDEAKNMAKFSQNNNIVNVFEYFEDNNTGYIVMEFLEGISLNNYLLKQTQKLPLDEIMNITMSVCAALKELHAIGIIHRDVSPDNIFMCSNGKIKLIDFGAARFSLNEEKKMTIILKPGFAPPEQYEKINKQGPWTDIYALGATVYLLLTGTKPDESTNRKVEDKVVPPSKLDSAIPEYISNTVMKAIALDKKNRFNSIEKFEKALLRKTKVANKGTSNKKNKSQGNGLLGTVLLGVALLISIAVCVLVIINNKKVNLKDASLTMWYTYESERDKDDKVAAVTQLVKEFNKTYPGVSISAVPYLKSDYTNAFSQEFSSNSGPQVFESTNVSDSLLTEAIDTKEILKDVNLNEYYLLSGIGGNGSYTKKVPLACNIPVLYINTELYGKVFASGIINQLSDVESEESLDKTIGVDNKYEQLYRDIYGSDSKYSSDYVISDALNSFTSGNLKYYFSTTKDYEYIQQMLPGTYSIVYADNGRSAIQYTDCFSINGKNLSAEQKKAALVFVRYMLSRIGQDIMYVSNSTNAIPLNKITYKEYIEVNSELNKFLSVIESFK